MIRCPQHGQRSCMIRSMARLMLDSGTFMAAAAAAHVSPPTSTRHAASRTAGLMVIPSQRRSNSEMFNLGRSVPSSARPHTRVQVPLSNRP